MERHIPPLIPFSTIVTYQYQLKGKILLWSFLKVLAMLIQELKESFAGSSLYILKHIFLKFPDTSPNNIISL